MSGIQQSSGHRQRGVVSLFVVIFAALLMTVITIGFVRLMIQEQQQATNNDLSQSAYDSAVAGVEDGKRVLRAAQLGSMEARDAIDSKECDTIRRAGIIAGAQTEVTIKGKNETGEGTLNQAYTCVKIFTETEDYVSEIAEDTSKIVRLDAMRPFSYIEVEWMIHGKLGGESSTVTQPTSGMEADLPVKQQWSTTAPALLRVQAVVPPDAASVSFDELNTNISSAHFLRPISVSGSLNMDAYSVPIRFGERAAGYNPANAPSAGPHAVTCSSLLYDQGGYACKAGFEIQGGSVPAGSKVAFLRLTSLYRGTSVRVKLYENGSRDTLVSFNNVQPLIDSTGRASNVFRRIASRVEPGVSGTASLPYPENAVDITGSLCKSFYVTDADAASSLACSTAPVAN